MVLFPPTGRGLLTLFLLRNISSAVGIDPCPTTAQSFNITSTAKAAELATALNCSGGGSFDVLWEGSVFVEETLALTDGIEVTITGVGLDATADGNGATQLFTVVNSTLNLADIALQNGDGFSGDNTLSSNNGGAILASGPNSVVSCSGTTSFITNSANQGGAVSIEDGAVSSWSGNTSFSENTATFSGGAVHVFAGSSVSWAGQTRFTQNDGGNEGGALRSSKSFVTFTGETTFADNTASTRGGALYASDSEVSWVGVTSFERSTATAGSDGGGTVESYNSVISWRGKTSFDGGTGGMSGALYASRSNISWAGETSFCDNFAKLSGGALSISDSTNVSWTGETTFCNNRATGTYVGSGTGGAMHVADSNVSWDGTTTFTNNSALSAGGAVYAQGNIVMAWVGDTVFEENVASTNGGAVALIGDMTLDIVPGAKNLSLNGNVASISGGAVYVSGMTYGLNITGASFNSNSALNGGGVYSVGSGTAYDSSSSYSHNEFIDCTFHNNTAYVSGGAMESAASRDEFMSTTFESNTARVGGGLRLAGTTLIEGCDFVGNGADEEGPAVSNVGTITLTDTAFASNSLICPDGEFLNYTVEGTGDNGQTDYYSSVCVGCDVCSGDCPVDGKGTQQCIAELENTVSPGFDKTSGVPITLETLRIDPGYWRSMKNSSIVLPCWNEDACGGGLTGSADYCDEAYRGPYCAICEKGYAPTLAYTCSKCADGEGITLAVVVLLVAVTAVIAVVFYLVSKHQQEEKNSRFMRLTKALPVQGLKTVVVAWQILTQFDAVANVTYAGVYGEFLDGISSIINFDLGLVLSAGCMVVTDFHDRLLVSTLGPLVALGVVAVCFKVATRRNQGSQEALQVVRRKHFSMALLITFLVYSSVSSTVFRVFDCETLDGGTDYLRADYTIECTDAKHKAFQVYGVFMILLYPVGIPVFYAVVLFRNRALVTDLRHRSEQRSAALQVTSSLWKPYKPSRYYYEVVECARRVTLTGVVVFIYPNTAAQVAVTLVLAFVFVMVSESLVPYATTEDAWLSRVGHIVVFLSMFQAMVIKVDVSDESSESQEVFGGVLLAANICMVAAVIAEAAMVVCSFCGRGDAAPKETVEPWVRNTASKKICVEKWETVEADGPPPFTGKVPEPLT